MLFLSILHHYMLWHYTKAFGEIAHIAKNFLWFTIHFFSIKQLALSLFSPWKRMTEEKGNVLNFEEMAEYIIINSLSRVVGMTLRASIILTGLVVLSLVLFGTFVLYIFWALAPIALVACLVFGIMLIFS